MRPADRPAIWPRRPRARAAPGRTRWTWLRPEKAKPISCAFSFATHALEELRELLGRHRLAVQEALHLVAAVALQEMELGVGLDALGDHFQVQRVTERDDGLGEDPVLGFRAAADVAHEGAVDLQRVDRQGLEIRERGIAGAEIV